MRLFFICLFFLLLFPRPHNDRYHSFVKSLGFLLAIGLTAAAHGQIPGVTTPAQTETESTQSCADLEGELSALQKEKGRLEELQRKNQELNDKTNPSDTAKAIKISSNLLLINANLTEIDAIKIKNVCEQFKKQGCKKACP